jgi:hypothetical protein
MSNRVLVIVSKELEIHIRRSRENVRRLHDSVRGVKRYYLAAIRVPSTHQCETLVVFVASRLENQTIVQKISTGLQPNVPTTPFGTTIGLGYRSFQFLSCPYTANFGLISSSRHGSPPHDQAQHDQATHGTGGGVRSATVLPIVFQPFHHASFLDHVFDRRECSSTFSSCLRTQTAEVTRGPANAGTMHDLAHDDVLRFNARLAEDVEPARAHSIDSADTGAAPAGTLQVTPPGTTSPILLKVARDPPMK